MSNDKQRRTVGLLVGGGVAPDLIAPVTEILEAASFDIDFERVDVPVPNRANVDSYLDEACEVTRRHGVALRTKFLPPVRAQRDGGPPLPNPNTDLRLRLGLFAGVRPIKGLNGLPTRYPGLDILLIRENSEDIYKGIEHEIVPGVVESMKVVTRDACDRIARYAYRIAAEMGRKKVTFIHKGNIMKRSDGLFMETVRAVAETEFDVVLMDCQMPIMDGFEAARAIRDMGVRDTPVIALTGNAFETDRRAALEAGMNAHVAKPVDLSTLSQVLGTWDPRGP